MYSFDSRVRYSECDETGRLSLFAAVNYLQDCSTFQSVELGMRLGGLSDTRLAWVLANWRIEVDRLPALGDGIRVSTWCHELTRAHALRDFTISAGGEDVVRADSQWFVFDAGSGHATRVPEDQRAYLSGEPALEMGPLERRIRPEGAPVQAPPVHVSRRHIDTNRHVNNARYVALALDALESVGEPAPEPPVTVQAQYRSMAFLGDVLSPVVHVSDAGWDVELAGPDGASRAIVRIRRREGDL